MIYLSWTIFLSHSGGVRRSKLKRRDATLDNACGLNVHRAVVVSLSATTVTFNKMINDNIEKL